MIFDGSINVVGMDVIGPEVDEETGMAPEGSHLQIALTIGIGVPVPQQTPEGLQLAVTPIPAGIARLPMSAEVAQRLVEELQTVIETIPEEEKAPTSDSVLIANKQMADQVIAQAAAVEDMKKGTTRRKGGKRG